jgi:hypothetical protein
MENLGLRETFSRLNLSEVEPKVRYTRMAQQLCIVDPEAFILDFTSVVSRCRSGSDFHFDTYPDPDPPTPSFSQVGKADFV